jgi:hypothetical protein
MCDSAKATAYTSSMMLEVSFSLIKVAAVAGM